MRIPRPMIRVLLLALPFLAGTLAVTLLAQGGSDAGAAARLHALFDREWEWELSESPLSASALGDKRWNDRWDDLSLAALDRRQHHREGVLVELDGIPRAAL